MAQPPLQVDLDAVFFPNRLVPLLNDSWKQNRGGGVRGSSHFVGPCHGDYSVSSGIPGDANSWTRISEARDVSSDRGACS